MTHVQDPKVPKPARPVNDDSLFVEIVNLGSFETYTLAAPYAFEIYVDYTNKYANKTARVELHSSSDPSVLGAATFIDAVSDLQPNTEGTVTFNLSFPYDTTDISFIPRVVREDDPTKQSTGLLREHLCIISGGM